MNYLKQILVAIFLISIGCTSKVETLNIYISPKGSNNNLGTKQSPYATLQKARDHIRSLSNAQRNTDIKVILREGTYQLTSTLVLGLQDGAVNGFTISYEAYPGEKPILSSGINIKSWKLLKSDYPDGFPQEAKGKVYVADFPDKVNPFYTMFDGFTRIPRAQKGGFLIHRFDKNKYRLARSMNVYDEEDRHLLRQFNFTDEEGILKNWKNLEDIEMGFAPVPWALNLIPFEKIDVKKREAWLAIEANAPPGAKLSHTLPWVENVIDYISEGTFVTNSKNRKVYYWPKQGKPSGNEVVPSLMEYIRIEGDIDKNGATDIPVKNIHVKGITFMHGDRYAWWDAHKGLGIQHDWDKFDHGNAMLRFRGAQNCLVENCRFTNSGNSAIRLDLYAQDITIRKNLIDYVGHMGILLCGYGPGTKDVNKNNVITNNLIHHVGQVITHGAGIFVWQSGSNIISHNLIHHVPRKGIGLCGVRMPILEKEWCDFDEGSKTIRWKEIKEDLKKRFNDEPTSLHEKWRRMIPYLHARNNIVEYNNVYRALEKLADGSVLNVSGAGENNIVRNNYVHHIASHASGAMRTDDWQRGTTFQNNIIYMSNISGIVHKGYNHIINNKIIDCSCKESIRWASYPDEGADYGAQIQRNIMYESEDKIQYYRTAYRVSQEIALPDKCATDYNLFWCKGKPEDAHNHIKYWNEREIETNSIAADPLFIGFEDKGFKLKPSSPAFTLGFEEINFEKIGLLDDYPQEYLKLDVNDNKDVIFDRNRTGKTDIYDFW